MPASTPLRPVEPTARVGAVDTLRGIAVLGILPMNILTGFALSASVFINPSVQGGFEGANYAVWLGTHLVFDLKMMAIFSMLFGAGLVLMDQRASGRDGGLGQGPGTPPNFAGVYYRRLLVLGIIGFIHAYFIWFGDILFIYAMCGLLLYPLRRMQPAVLVVGGLALIMVAVGTFWAFGAMMDWFARTNPAEWERAAESMVLTPEALADEQRVRSGEAGYLAYLGFNATQALSMHTFLFVLFALWRVLGLMLLGMGLMRLGVLNASRSAAFYGGLAALGYGVGFPIILLGVSANAARDFDPLFVFQYGMSFNYVGSLFVALGHIGLVMLVCKLGLLRTATSWLASVGRMPLTNYLLQTAICVTIFSILGCFGRLDRVQLLGVTVAIWAVCLVLSRVWMSKFRYGPMEWLWRSATYLSPQPIRLQAAIAGK